MKSFAVALAATFVFTGLCAPRVQAELYCKSVTGEVEGFGESYTRFTAERSRDKAVAAQKAGWGEMGRKVVKIEPHDTECKAVYPLGFEEWHCVAKTDVCVER